MAGTTVTATPTELMLGSRRSATHEAIASLNRLVDDVELVRAGANRHLFSHEVDPGAAGTDISARGVFVAPAALTILDSVKALATDAITGVDGSNTLVLTLRNITEGVDVATVTRTTTASANTVIALTLASANADIAANDVLGLTVTQGATADAARLMFQFEYAFATADAADLTAYKVADEAGTVIT